MGKNKTQSDMLYWTDKTINDGNIQTDSPQMYYARAMSTSWLGNVSVVGENVDANDIN